MSPSLLKPVFIAGCDRSGTTMLGDMLGAAEGAFAGPESQWIHDWLPWLHAGAFADAREAATWLRGHFRFVVWELSLSDTELAELIDLSDPRRSIDNILRAYHGQNADTAGELKFWVDHTPDNFKHYALLQHYFPDARYLHIVRDGRAVYDSIRHLDWGPNNAYMATRHWHERLVQALEVEIAEGDRCARVRYEDLLDQPQDTLQRLCEHAQLEYSDALVGGGGLLLPHFTRKQHKLVGKAPDPSRAQAWQARLSSGQIAEFEAYAPSRRLLELFGYSLHTEAPQAPRSLVVLWRYVEDFLLYLFHRRKHRKLERGTVRKQP